MLIQFHVVKYRNVMKFSYFEPNWSVHVSSYIIMKVYVWDKAIKSDDSGYRNTVKGYINDCRYWVHIYDLSF